MVQVLTRTTYYLLFTSCSQSKFTNKSGASNGVVVVQHVHNRDVRCKFFEIERIYPGHVHHVAGASGAAR